jgi:Uma2 family endonuclease
MRAMATTLELLTAEEYSKLPDDGRPTQLVRGQVIEMNPPSPRHGKICLRIGGILANFVETHDLGHVVGNDSAIVTSHNPDTVRGADLAYYSYSRLPKGPVPDGYLSVVPELVVEVLSPDDRWSNVHAKAAEYLEAGISVVCVVDPKTESAHVYYPNEPPRTVTKDADLTFPEILADFRVPVPKLFE